MTNALIVSNLGIFWFVLTYHDPWWSHYAFYIWSAIVGVTAVAQLWTLANHLFTPDEGIRSFGFVTAGGTVGGALAGFGVKRWLHLFAENNHLMWVVAALYVAASALVLWGEKRLEEKISEKELKMPLKPEEIHTANPGELLAGSAYLKTIAVLILVSVIVSTLIDFQFKTAAKQAYASRGALAGFFSSYYGWLSVASLFTQLILMGKTLRTFGLQLSLYLTPGVLLVGTTSIMIWPSLLVAAATRMADATLRNSIHKSGMEIVYMALAPGIMRRVKSFLDVTVERAGDAIAGFIILLFSFASTENYITYVHFICIALIFVWIVLIPVLCSGRSEPSPKEPPASGEMPMAENGWAKTGRLSEIQFRSGAIVSSEKE
ncbi:MAG TPA: Npt1/Npt2 family nucleotide transporter [candidate division Zixibacteria bacterium]|nr:Npt1/Npt2 family nucleotide transporter [candidate division Zixibacteria bacterium]